MRKLLTCLVALTVTAAANAGPINYQESVSGDLPTFGSPLPTFTFDVGTNTISGTFGLNTNADFDSFAFVVPAGMRLVSAKVTLADGPGVGDMSAAGWSLYSGSANAAGGSFLESVSPTSPGVYSFLSTPLGPQTYNIAANFFSWGGPSPVSANYVFSFDVVATPEPVSLVVFGGLIVGGAGVALRRRMAKASA